VIVFRTDFRSGDELGKAPFNLMLTESASACLDLTFEDTEKRIFASMNFIVEKIIHVLDKLVSAAAERP
jgi:hypothetical protein